MPVVLSRSGHSAVTVEVHVLSPQMLRAAGRLVSAVMMTCAPCSGGTSAASADRMNLPFYPIQT